MKIYLAGLGANEKALLKICKKQGRVFRRLVSYAYLKETMQLLNLKEKENKHASKRNFKRIKSGKTGSSD